jgi:RNA recognition motif-containing protein
MNLYVSNISRTAQEDALKELFAAFGEVTSAKIISDRYTGESKGFGFVEMSNTEEAKTAMQELTNVNFCGRNLVIAEAKPKTDSRTSSTNNSNSSGFNRY